MSGRRGYGRHGSRGRGRADNPGGGRRGGGGGAEPGRGGCGGQRWWDPEWRRARLDEMRGDRTPFDEADVRRALAVFKQTPAPEQLLDFNFDKGGLVRLQAIARDMELYCESYGQGSSRNIVVSKAPLARYRAEYDNVRSALPFSLSDGSRHAVQTALAQFRALGVPALGKRPRSQFQDRQGPPRTNERDDGAPDCWPAASADEPNADRGAGASPEGDDLPLQCAGGRSSSNAPESMLAARRLLPAYSSRNEFLRALRSGQVVVVSGATGSGKTTQLPQFILDEAISAGRGGRTRILCTQPRRISAVSIAARVAEERGQRLGDSVGYKIRLESRESAATRLLFVTTGVLLRRLMNDPTLQDVSHVVVDEIHERGINEDVLLIILRDLLTARPDLKLVLMSATLNAASFQTYFPGAQLVQIAGITHPVEIAFLEDVLEQSGLEFRGAPSLSSSRGGDGSNGGRPGWRRGGRPRAERLTRSSPLDDVTDDAVLSHARSDGCAASLEAWLAAMREASASLSGAGMTQVAFVADVVVWLHRTQAPGAMLVFLTGFQDIKSVNDELQRAAQTGALRGANIVPLHGSMPTIHQRSIFDPSPSGVRKILLATNIAETSITIDDVTIVVDCGLHKLMTYDTLNKIRMLTPNWVSKANAKQRSGRAGRVAPGKCFRLYPSALHAALPEFLPPEMQRVPLESVCLQIKGIGVGRVGPFLATAMDPPDAAAVEQAVAHLTEIGAVDGDEDLTALGRHLAQLPVDPSVGKLILMGAIFDSLNPVLTIAASLSVRDPFVAPLERREQADAAKRTFAGGQLSDHCALLRAFERFRRLRADAGWSEVRRWCSANFLVADTLAMIDDMRLQLAQIVRDAGFLRFDGNEANHSSLHQAVDEHSTRQDDAMLLKALLVAGLYPNVASVWLGNNPHSRRPPTLKTHTHGKVAIHPSSVLAARAKSEFEHAWLVFTSMLMTTDTFLSTATVVPAHAILLFGGSLRQDGRDPRIVTVGRDTCQFEMAPETAGLIMELRKDIDALLDAKLASPELDVAAFGAPLISAVSHFLADAQSAPPQSQPQQPHCGRW